MRIYYLGFSLLLLLSLNGCFTIDNQYTGLAPGPWRATLDLSELSGAPKIAELEEEQYDFNDTPPNHLPFNFEVHYTNEEDFYLELQNGEERIKVTDIQIGRDRRTNRDTFLIDFPVYDSYLKGIFMGRVMEGEWVVKNRTNYRLPFVAKFGKNYRFTQLKETPTLDISGTWEVMFEDSGGLYPGIGEFTQEGNEIRGTFLTETGDYRYLEGTIQKDKLYLSVFDGAHAFLFEAKVLEDKSMIGIFKSGRHYQATWTAKKNDQATLTAPTELTYMKEATNAFDFSFENADGQLISLQDEQYQDKVKLVQIFGTWCPNCRDETKFLVDYFKKHPNDQIAIVGLAFEKHKDQAKAKDKLRTYKQRMDIPYELLLAGTSDKSDASQVLSMLNKVISYPTLLFLNKKNEVVKIHTGFSGPATSKYEDFVLDFEKTIEKLVSSD